jgi:hypothetical protein
MMWVNFLNVAIPARLVSARKPGVSQLILRVNGRAAWFRFDSGQFVRRM